MRARHLLIALSLVLSACGGDDATAPRAASSSSGVGGTGGASAVANADGDCLSDEEEAALGTDPTLADSDGDGTGDCEEVACVSDPTDGVEECYACGWKHDAPEGLASTGHDEGDVIENLALVDQCMEPLQLWDFAREYHILFMTAAW